LHGGRTLRRLRKKEQTVPPPSLDETKAIAEEGFIYGLPIVMNYAVRNEFCVDPASSQYKGQPLSAFLKQPAPPAAPKIDLVPATTAGIKENFFAHLDAALQFVPASADNQAILAKLAYKDLSVEHKAAALLGMKEGDDKVTKLFADGMKDANGWKVGSLFDDREFYNGDWLKRAAGVVGGIYGKDGVEAMYPMSRVDVTGETLDGSKHAYTLTFPAGQLPPVNAFWSVTMYDGKSQLLIENPINRYLINSPMLPNMKMNGDGSLTLYIQKDNPGKDKESNWLPAPNDTISLVMRLYWPKTDGVSILPPGQGTWNPPGVVKVN